MRSFWVKRGEWVIGPVTEQQIRQMAQQQWFRSADLVGIREEGPWTPARSVVPSRGFNAEQTLHRDSVLEPVAPALPRSCLRMRGNPIAGHNRVLRQNLLLYRTKHRQQVILHLPGSDETMESRRRTPLAPLAPIRNFARIQMPHRRSLMPTLR